MNLEAVVHNFGRQSKSRQAVELWIDGRRMEQKFVEVPPGGEVAAAFAYRFETPGDHAVEVRAPGDALEVDNVRYLSLPVRQAIRVLVHRRPSVRRAVSRRGRLRGGGLIAGRQATNARRSFADSSRNGDRVGLAGARSDPLRLLVLMQRRAIHRQ